MFYRMNIQLLKSNNSIKKTPGYEHKTITKIFAEKINCTKLYLKSLILDQKHGNPEYGTDTRMASII